MKRINEPIVQYFKPVLQSRIILMRLRKTQIDAALVLFAVFKISYILMGLRQQQENLGGSATLACLSIQLYSMLRWLRLIWL
jgi:hypothetical protein